MEMSAACDEEGGRGWSKGRERRREKGVGSEVEVEGVGQRWKVGLPKVKSSSPALASPSPPGEAGLQLSDAAPPPLGHPHPEEHSSQGT